MDDMVQDIGEAIQWVKQHIRSFGGNKVSDGDFIRLSDWHQWKVLLKCHRIVLKVLKSSLDPQLDYAITRQLHYLIFKLSQLMMN